MQKNVIKAVLVVMLVASTVAPVRAIKYVKWNAPGPTHNGANWRNAYLTIQQALDVAANGELVFVAGAVAPGAVYPEKIVFKSGAILRGGYRGDYTISLYDTVRNPATYITVIDGGANTAGTRTVTSFADGTVDGFTIRGAETAIYCNTTFTVSANNITSGKFGVYCVDSSPTIDGNTVSGGPSTTNGIVCGSTAWCQGYGTCRASVTNNTVSGWAGGSQIIAWGSYYRCQPAPGSNWAGQSICEPTIRGNTVIGGGAGSTGIGCVDSSPVVEMNTISSAPVGIVCLATAADFGWAGAYAGTCTGSISSNTITDCNAGVWCYATRATNSGPGWSYSVDGDCRPTIGGNKIGRCGNGLVCNRATPYFSGNIVEDSVGSGIYCYNDVSSEPMISLTIDGNILTRNARGVRSNGISITITNNSIWGNNGEGVLCEAGSASIVTDNTISGGSVGVKCAASSPTVARNIITGAGVGGVVCQSSDSAVDDNLIAKCQASGVDCQGGSAKIRNNTIVRSTAGIQVESGTPVAYNNIVAHNSTGFKLFTGSATLGYNDFWANDTDYDGVTKPTTDVAIDPTFLAPDIGEYHLKPGSPCIGVGSNTYVAAGDKDADGKARILPVGGTVDMGCFEWDETPYWVRGAGQAKVIPAQYNIQMKSKAVSALWSDSFYLQDYDRNAGIRVEKTAHGLTANDLRASVVGAVLTNTDGERYVLASSVDPAAGNAIVMPLGMSGKSIGGGNWQYNVSTGAGQKGIAGAYGLNNIGLLITTWGKFTKTSDTTFTLDDGSGVNVKCVVAAADMPSPLPAYAVVTGISSCEKVGEELHRLLRVRDQNDIVPLQSGP